jgi:hypothetical protein
MTLRSRPLALLALLAALAAGGPSAAPAEPPAAAPAPEEIEAAALEAAWVQRIEDAQARLAAARARRDEAEASYGKLRQRERLQGATKEEVLAAREEAERDIAALEEEVPRLLEEARRAGVQPGALRRFETP